MDENEHHKEVYAYFGLAVYEAQVLESGLINALVALDFIPSNVHYITTRTDWSNNFDAFFDGRASQTMGNLIQGLRKMMTIPDEMEEQLKVALHERKFLVHHYFRERVMLFTTQRGREEMIKDFEGYANSFRAADAALTEVVEPIMARYGLTSEKLAALLKKITEEHQSKNC